MSTNAKSLTPERIEVILSGRLATFKPCANPPSG